MVIFMDWMFVSFQNLCVEVLIPSVVILEGGDNSTMVVETS